MGCQSPCHPTPRTDILHQIFEALPITPNPIVKKLNIINILNVIQKKIFWDVLTSNDTDSKE